MNLIGQSSTSENPHLISVGAEGLRGGTHALWLVHNTCIDDRPGGGILAARGLGLDRRARGQQPLRRAPRF